RPISSVLEEAQKLVNAGTRELLVISQDTSAYGVDVKYKLDFNAGSPLETRMQDLAVALGELGVWVRLHYVYPYPHVDKIIPLMAEGKILPYLDIPFQHASKKVLKAMKRPAHSEKVLDRIKKWRELCPDLTIRSTFIVGFPGETEEDFKELLEFLDEAQLDRVGCFTYSPVEGAPANDLPDHVPSNVAEDRKRRFMEKQAAISARRLQRKVGTRQFVIIDEIADEGAVGRTMGDAPEIDGQVFIDGATFLDVGMIVEVEIEEADEYDLWAHLV
ncbi:radical SAM protein, partial [Oleiphilus sp. HI0067]